ncbi:MAG: DUF4198 domain-containing protein [Candidatus Adiutrix sp.]|jgi:uncharacterized GH25 family protein|nr:DUF4198 domain-containing protein [Candidatus Adiutrix sp.]
MKTKFIAVVLFVILLSAPALAHDFWAGAKPAEEGQPLAAILGFGHNFPEGEAIKDEQIGSRYKPLRLIGPKGEIALKKGPEAKLFVSEEPLGKGTCLVLAATVPSFRTTTPDGPVAKPKTEAPGATACAFSSSYGKAVVNVGGLAETEFIAKPVGQELEIVPQANPANIKPGQKLPVKVIFKGKPLPGATLEAYFGGFSDDGSYAFSGRTDKEGLVNIIPLKSGDWLAKVSQSQPYQDLDKCDVERFNSSLTFTIFD